MAIRHSIQGNECLSILAARYRFRDTRTIYDHPDNAELRRKRPNPNMLTAGDVVVIPDKQPKGVQCATGKQHRFEVVTPLKKLDVVVRNGKGQPLAEADFVLEVDGEIFEGTTGGDGRVLQDVPMHAESATLTVGGRVWQLAIGALNPVEETDDGGLSGVQARLHNLGIDPGPVDGKFGPRTRYALASFQTRHGLKVTGKLNDATLQKIKEVHGS